MMVTPIPPIRVSFLFSETGQTLDVTQLGPAIDIALEKVSKQVDKGELLNFTFTKFERTTVRGGQVIGVGLVADLVQMQDINVVFGPGISAEMFSIADLVSYWNIPAITGGAITSDLEDRTRFTTFTRTSFRAEAMANFLSSLFGKYNWKICSVLYTRRGIFNLLSNAVLGVLDRDKIKIIPLSIDDRPNVTVLINETKKDSRKKQVVFFSNCEDDSVVSCPLCISLCRRVHKSPGDTHACYSLLHSIIAPISIPPTEPDNPLFKVPKFKE
ncbi:putative atrial natriuretic peptide receptor 1-like isoform X1 [Apostichopus japonicus]|uniref:Putative atrial natriuretic peptide receptor 1-like isoform X1 n=1 Tax=Stichopus japonicus TaxID=307972 RepID=A0A2G8JI82_STIJA|nr:putative atrial natriuretic peptide receptor 1-like isoform X1 [Apostichopus japonicus]